MRNNKWLTIFIFLIILFIKGIFFTFLGASNTGRTVDGVSMNFYLIVPHLALIGIILFPSLFINERGMKKYLIIVDLIYSILLIADLWVYRASGYFLGLKYVFFKDLFNPLRENLFNPSIIDIIFVIDIVVFSILYFKAKNEMKELKRVRDAIIGCVICLTLVVGCHYLFDIKKIFGGKVGFLQEDWGVSWNPSTRMANRSPLGEHIYEGYQTLKKVFKNQDESEVIKVDDWLAWNNENLPDNEFSGMLKGKNVVFLQIEALENFVIDQEVYGQEITPVMNKLVKEGLYFNNIYEQNNAGNSIDCDMMINTGVLPLGDTITFLTHPEVKYNSLPRILQKEGYTAVSTHAEKAGDWSWAEAHKAALGYNDMWNVNDYNIDEYVGFGLSDRSFYTQYVDKLTTLKEPFFSTIPTLSSHGPFDIKDKYRELILPEELDSNRLGGYFQSIHYADEQIGLFLKLLEEKGLMDDTVVVIYGDHGGIHKYYMEDVEETSMPGEWWQDYKKQIPLIVYGKGLPSKTVETIGGHIDIMPTISYLLGVETGNTVMGRNLLNTNRNATVIKGNEIKGNPSKEEKERLLQAYDIADYMIKNDYFKNKGIID